MTIRSSFGTYIYSVGCTDRMNKGIMRMNKLLKAGRKASVYDGVLILFRNLH